MQRLNLSDVNINTKEGRYLMAALVKLTTESQTDKTPDEVMEQCYVLQEEMYKKEKNISQESSFEKELESLINKNSLENGSDTPDFILAHFLSGCLRVFNSTLQSREAWHGRGMSIMEEEVKL